MTKMLGHATLEMLDLTRVVRSHLRGGRALFAKMEERAEGSAEYAAGFLVWLRHGSTLRLRELVVPFGDYWRDLEFANTVDYLDTAMAHVKH